MPYLESTPRLIESLNKIRQSLIKSICEIATSEGGELFFQDSTIDFKIINSNGDFQEVCIDIIFSDGHFHDINDDDSISLEELSTDDLSILLDRVDEFGEINKNKFNKITDFGR